MLCKVLCKMVEKVQRYIEVLYIEAEVLKYKIQMPSETASFEHRIILWMASLREWGPYQGHRGFAVDFFHYVCTVHNPCSHKILTNFYVTIIWWKTDTRMKISLPPTSNIVSCTFVPQLVVLFYHLLFLVLLQFSLTPERKRKNINIFRCMKCWLVYLLITSKTTSLNNLHSIKWNRIPVAYNYGEGPM